MSDHVLDRLSAFLDEELPAREQEAVEGHLRSCSACAARLELLRAVDAEARVLTVSVPDGYFDSLPARIRGRLEKSPRRRATPALPVWTWAAAAALLLAVVTPLTLNRRAGVSPAATAAYRPAPDAGVKPEPDAPSPASAAAGKDITLEDRSVKEESPSVDRQLEAKLRVDAGSRTQQPAPPAPPARAPQAGSAPPEDRKVQETVVADAEAPAMAPPSTRPRPAAPGGPYAQQQAPVQSQSTAAFAEAPVEAPAAGAEGASVAASNETARDEGLLKRDAPARQKAAGGSAAGRVSSAVGSSDEKVFRLLQEAATPGTLAALRERREAWRSFTRDFPASPRVDEARVRVVETGIEAWRAGGDAADLALTRADAATYLARRDAAQALRVRALVETLPETP
jgi:hypothetical protein